MSDKLITIRMTALEKEYFEERSRRAGESLSGYIRYQLRDIHLEMERELLMEVLKENAVGGAGEEQALRRAEALKQFQINIVQSVAWYRAKVKHCSRQIDRLERAGKRMEQFAASMQAIFEDDPASRAGDGA